MNHERRAVIARSMRCLNDQCPERCLGIVGHAGPHQTSDYEPPLRIEHAAVEARDRQLAEQVRALPRYDETLDTLTEDADGAPLHLGVYDPNAVYLDAVLRLLDAG